MKDKIEELLLKLDQIEKDISIELAKRQSKFIAEIKDKRISLEKKFLETQKIAKVNIAKFLWQSSFLTILTAPVIYSLIIPAVLMDVFVGIYQCICFPVYKIKKVNRSDYIVIDRHKLPYLNAIEKLNCVYCGYFNGLIAYVREVASLTEQYWCPIRHALKSKDVHHRMSHFLDYGDAENLQKRLQDLREQIQNLNKN